MITVEELKSKTPERLWSKIRFDESDKCWEWQASTDKFGYCWFSSSDRGKSMTIRAHKYVYQKMF